MKVYDYANLDERKKLFDLIRKRNIQTSDEITKKVNEIVDDVRKYKDAAVFDLTYRFDKVSLDASSVRVNKREIEEAYSKVDDALIKTIKKASSNIREYHENQLQKGFLFNKGKNSSVGQIVRPLEIVGIYVPGGTAPLPSSVLMNAIPAKVAGVKRIIMSTPPKNEGLDPALLIAANEAGVDEIFKVGGAQAIAAMAYGTETIPKVDKITGPGNVYVVTAKRIVFGICDIDIIAGPSEICIIADDKSNKEFIAADMLSQAEHDTDSASFLITTEKDVASQLINLINDQLGELNRKKIAKEAIDANGVIIYAKDISEAIEISNMIAPEHLELFFQNADDHIDKIRNAGAVFIGEYSPEPLGDYYAGSNHVLPTSGTARFSSPLGVYDFLKKISYINYSKQDLKDAKENIVRFAEYEGLGAHANSISIRFGEDDD